MFDFEKTRRLVDATGVKRDVIATKCGWKHTSFNQVLCGVSRPSIEKLVKLADFLGVGIEDLITRQSSAKAS